jgi:hypothetical protein
MVIQPPQASHLKKMLGLIGWLHADASADDFSARDRRRHARNLGHAWGPITG